MGAFLDRPRTEKHNESGEGNGLRYGLSSMQGWRVEMEDAHSAIVGMPRGFADWSFFAVFDGHAGARVSAHSSKRLLDFIISNADFRGGLDAPPDEWRPTYEDVCKGVRTGFLELDADMRNLPEIATGEDRSGSTAICVIVTPDHFVFANCGDSRGLVSRTDSVSFHTEDHKPTNPAERDRITKAGGQVMIQRVNGSLAVSRALGDFDYKSNSDMGPCDQLVSPEPEVTRVKRETGDQFIVLACDGIFDVMTNEEVADFVRYHMKLTNNLTEICNKIVDTCLHKGSRDNMSIVIVALPGAPTLCPETQATDASCEEKLREHVARQFGVAPDIDAASIVHSIASGDTPIEGLPVGGGVHTKYSMIEETLENLKKEYIKKGND